MAVGTYGVNYNSAQAGVVVPISAGVPGAAREISLPANANTSTPLVWINSVSCWSGGSCVAAGQYQAGASTGYATYPLVVPISSGVAATGVEVTLPADAYTSAGGQQSILASVSCRAKGTCIAVGSYVNTNGGTLPLSVATRRRHADGRR